MNRKTKQRAWVRREIRVSSPLGLHLRPAASLVRTALPYRCDFRIRANGQCADGRSLMGVMLLRAPCGTVLSLEATGVDAARCVDAVASVAETTLSERWYS